MTNSKQTFLEYAAEAVVVGAGHAGCEAALALARTGINTALLTLNLDSIAFLPCNPSIGGTGKGQPIYMLGQKVEQGCVACGSTGKGVCGNCGGSGQK